MFLCLKRYHKNSHIEPPPPPEVVDDELEWEVERIINHRLVKRGRQNKLEYLIKFLGYGPEHNMWQDDVGNCEQLVQQYWAGKPVSERLVVMLYPYNHRAQVRKAWLASLPVPP